MLINLMHEQYSGNTGDALQVALREVVGAGGSEATWQELSGLTPASRVQVSSVLYNAVYLDYNGIYFMREI